jgi:DNA-binding transcriptional MerR regulator
MVHTIGALANQCGVSVETIRFYQRRGLLKTPKRPIGIGTVGGIRRYGEEDAQRLRFIRAAQVAGFTLRQIQELLSLDASQNRARVRELATLAFSAVAFSAESDSISPRFTADGQLQRPTDYRDWVFLTSGLDMSYSSEPAQDQHEFDNVFVNPSAYQAFLKNGTWPDGTMLLIEARAGTSKGSINKRGAFQTTEVLGLEVHVKDSKRFEGSWAFFGFADAPTAKMIPQTAYCYSCHVAHAAVDTTFVQFYPTLIGIATAKGTLSANYQKESKSQ